MIPFTHLAPLLWQAQLSPPDTGGLNPIVSILAFLVMLVILVSSTNWATCSPR